MTQPLSRLSSNQIDLAKLRQLIVDHFSEDEVRTLCLDLNVNYDALPGQGTAGKARELTAHFQRHRNLVKLAEAVLEERPHLSQQLITLESGDEEPPFKGLRYFDEADADLFFGRKTLTDQLVTRLLPPSTDGKGPEGSENCLTVVGASGSGKSSLVRAGMVPAIRRQVAWPIHVITPTAHPLKALATSLTRDAESVTATARLIDDLAQDRRSLDLYVHKIVKDSQRLLLVVDQLEELFTLCKDEAERTVFIDNLLNAVALETAGLTTIIIALRADFYHYCAQYDGLREALAQHQAYIGPMNRDELCQAIEIPAARNGLSFETGLVDLLLRDVSDEPGALPLLSHALLETWRRREANTLTLAGYYASGGVRGAIAQTAETTFNERLTPEQRTIARNIFLRLTELGEGTQDMRRRANLDELIPQNEDAPVVEVVLKVLADARLVTTDEGAAEVAHEALIREWPTLRTWLDENREGLRIHRRLTEAAQEWDANSRHESYLYRGVRLDQALLWREQQHAELNRLEREFLEDSREAAIQAEHEKEAARQRELEQARTLAEEQRLRAEVQATAARRLRYFNAAMGIFFIVILFGGFFLFSLQSQAAEERLTTLNALSERATADAARGTAQAGQATAEVERGVAQAEQATSAVQIATGQAQVEARQTGEAVREAAAAGGTATFRSLAVQATIQAQPTIASNQTSMLAIRQYQLDAQHRLYIRPKDNNFMLYITGDSFLMGQPKTIQMLQSMNGRSI